MQFLQYFHRKRQNNVDLQEKDMTLMVPTQLQKSNYLYKTLQRMPPVNLTCQLHVSTSFQSMSWGQPQRSNDCFHFTRVLPMRIHVYSKQFFSVEMKRDPGICIKSSMFARIKKSLSSANVSFLFVTSGKTTLCHEVGMTLIKCRLCYYILMELMRHPCNTLWTCLVVKHTCQIFKICVDHIVEWYFI